MIDFILFGRREKKGKRSRNKNYKITFNFSFLGKRK